MQILIKIKQTNKYYMKKRLIGIASTIRNLSLYEKAIFPIEKYSVVSATIQRLQTESKSKLKFSQKKNNENETLEVIKTA